MAAFESVAVPDFGVWGEGLTDQARKEQVNGGGLGEINTPGSSAVAKLTNLLSRLGARPWPLKYLGKY